MSTPALPIPLVDLSAIHTPIRAELTEAFERVLASGAFSNGPEVEAFERDFADYVNAAHAIGVGSGTSAIQIALMAAGIGPGDEVILPANTFFATYEAVVLAGATPVLCDAVRETALIDPASVEACITERTAAVIAVHLYGQPVPMERLRPITTAHGLFLLEDAAQAVGASRLGVPAGSLGDAAAFSFYAGKNLGALGEAGGITTDDAALTATACLLREHGMKQRYVHEIVGMNERMDGLQGAFLRVKLAHLPRWQKERDVAQERYADGLSRIPGLRPLTIEDGSVSVHHLLPIFVENRDALLASLRDAQIGSGMHYPTPIHLLPAVEGLGEVGAFPVAEELARQTVSLPLYPGISEDQVDYVLEILARELGGSTS